jgi:hypothetical protein
MRALKTIVATAVIVFALTAVATAGVQHFGGQDGQDPGPQARQATPPATVTLTAAQFEQLVAGQGSGATKPVANAQRTREQQTERVRDAVRTTTGDHVATQAGATGSASDQRRDGTGTCTPNAYEYEYDHDWSGSGDGQHGACGGDRRGETCDGGCR